MPSASALNRNEALERLDQLRGALWRLRGLRRRLRLNERPLFQRIQG